MNTADVLKRLTHNFFLCFWELSLRHSVNACKVITILYTVRYCVLQWDVLIRFTHKSIQQPALLAILNILTYVFSAARLELRMYFSFSQACRSPSRPAACSGDTSTGPRCLAVILTTINPYNITVTPAQAPKPQAQIWGRV